MTAHLVNLVVLGALCALAAWWRGPRRLLVPAVAVLCGAALGVGLLRQVLIPADLLVLSSLTGVEGSLFQLAAWALFAASAASAGWRESSRWAPVAFGALFGELGGALLALQGVDDSAVRARRVVAATAGAMLGRVADPAAWLLVGDSTHPAGLIVVLIVACIGVGVAAPPMVEALETHRPRAVLFVGLSVWVLSWVSSLQLPVVAGGALVLWWLGRGRIDLRPLARVLALSFTAAVAIVAGVAEQWAQVLESQLVVREAIVPLWIWLNGAVSGLALGSDGGGLFGRAVLDRALAVRYPHAAWMWGLGAAVAGLAPYLVTGTLWRAWPRHGLWLLLSGAVVAGAFGLGFFAP